jgi:hypothetical protein
VKKQQID